ncbi:MAG: hypothetical protein GF315_10805 [candidate division Zixibacteria bacterium]|nr:hypothetical protein [candidate division Zixibacteria bacterium]
MRLPPFIKILRPLNGLIASLTVWISYFIAGGEFNQLSGIIAAIAGFLFNGFANSVNDIIDIEIDRINRPDRPLSSGKMSRKSAIIESGILGLSALVLSASLGVKTSVIGLIAIVCMVTYNIKLKNIPLLGNIMVSFTAALAFLYGGAAYGELSPVWLPAVFAFLLHLGREIIKDIEDIKGDSAMGAKTLPIVLGIGLSRKLTAMVLAVFIVVTLLPIILQHYGIGYSILIFLIDIVLFVIIWGLLRVREINAAMISQTLKALMPLGIAAVYLGVIGL